MRIEKKTLDIYFERIRSGEKKFELRLADWPCSPGDVLVLREVDDKGNYTGRVMEKEVLRVIRTKEIDFWPKEDINKYGFQIISFE